MQSLCYPLAINNLLTRAMNAAVQIGAPKVTDELVMAAIRGGTDMRRYQVLITFDDGRRGVLSGLFASDWQAIDMVYRAFDDEMVLAAVPRRLEVA